MNNQYYFVCNHWTEGGIGYAFPKGWYHGKFYERGFSSVYTVEKMLDSADMYGIVASMELDAYTYEVLAEVSPETLERLNKYISEGKASVEGGTYGQPLGQDYGWESNIRQLTYGRRTIKELLNYDVNTFLVEEQYFFPQLPQLLLKSGFKYASLQCQNSGQVMPLNKSMIDWRGLDGSVIPTIPANNIMVSCVRQYGDYTEYLPILEKYDNPLLFQWVEIWVPGMDWGASVTPFDKAIKHALDLKMIPTTLNNYFEKELDNIERDEIFIDLDSSNYRNDWYQGGGWGFEGDKVMFLNNIAEQKLAVLETYVFNRLLNTSSEDLSDTVKSIWKRLLILQNHDTSAARSYRAYTKDGVMTNANNVVLKELASLIDDVDFITENSNRLKIGSNKICFPTYNKGFVTTSFVIGGTKKINITVDGKNIPISQFVRNNEIVCQLTIEAEPYKVYELIVDYCEDDIIKTDENNFTVKNIEITHKDGWSVLITDKESHTEIVYEAFTGAVGKANEHDGNFHSLSPAHLQFTFQFDGAKHCPDQTSSMHVKCTGTTEDPLYKTLHLYCDLLTLHTTEVPVAFASAEVRVNKITGEVDTNAYIYTGVFLNVSGCSKFTHNINDAHLVRDYPFYEEETKLNDIYVLSYLRCVNDEKAFTIATHANQKVIKNGNEIKFVISKDKLFFDYNFNFSIKFDTFKPVDSLNFVNHKRSLAVKIENDLPISKQYESTIISSLFCENGNRYARIVNYSENQVTENISICGAIAGTETNMLGETIGNVDLSNLKMNAFEIKTIKL